MKYHCELVAMSLRGTTAQYRVSVKTATIHIDVHNNGAFSATNFMPEVARVITNELSARYVAAQGNWPKTHTFEVK